MKISLYTVGICYIIFIIVFILWVFIAVLYLWFSTKKDLDPESETQAENPFKNPLDLPKYPEGLPTGDI